MKIAFILFTLLSVLSLSSRAENDISTRFIEAQQAFDAGSLEHAIRTYENILQEGTYAPELLYNLGNTHFRNKQPGYAMLRYQQALRSAPSDPKIRANIKFVQEQTGAILPSEPSWKKPLLAISGSTWSALAILLLWTLCILAVLAVALPSYRATLFKGILWIAASGIIALIGILQHHQRFSADQIIVLEKPVEALFAPLKKATPHFALPTASLADVIERNGNWVKIRSGKEEGWIPQSACANVYPWY